MTVSVGERVVTVMKSAVLVTGAIVLDCRLYGEVKTGPS